MRKLTDEELSRVLGRADLGKLMHPYWGSRECDPERRGCGCVAGAVHAAGEISTFDVGMNDREDMWQISSSVSPFMRGDGRYRAEGPDAVLRMLEKAGLA